MGLIPIVREHAHLLQALAMLLGASDHTGGSRSRERGMWS
jgi:hypothetical protein